ncbi:MAG: PH domain-containing protein [Chloroflexi bacterium]|nr:PH domain-containing protein [Chloroflexota bacterium]
MAAQVVARNPVSTPERIVRFLSTFVVATPFLAGGLITLVRGDAPIWAAAVLIAVAALLGSTGLYMTLVVIQPSPRLVDGESVFVVRSPTMKPAYARLTISIPFLITAWYLSEFTFSPYVYPFAAMLVGLFFFFSGAYRYWINQRTAYYVTNRRVVRIYEFLWLHTTEIPVSRIVSISESRGFFEMLTGRGSVIVASGIGARQTVRLSDIDDPGEVADALRSTIE